jgi:hypothetical protein
MEQEFNNLPLLGINLDVSWSTFGNADRSDLDDLFVTNNIHGKERLTVVDLWKRHPNRQQGKINSIVSHILFNLFFVNLNDSKLLFYFDEVSILFSVISDLTYFSDILCIVTLYFFYCHRDCVCCG